MSPINRRRFMHSTLAATAAAALPGRLASARRRRSDEVSIAVIGQNGRGRDLLHQFHKLAGVRIAALCDVDRAVLEREATALAAREIEVAAETDLRRVLDRPDIDAVVIATPNHWHALATVWACQAGKDVYVEKPVSHNISEGRRMVEAARKYGRIVQTGTQSRSSHGIRDAVAWVAGGGLGPIRVARGLCYKPRQSIGKVAGPVEPPTSVDYDLWVGPAVMQPLRRERLHYDWHWLFETGNGDLGNQGIHQMDICRWFLGQPKLAPWVIAAGGRFGYDDDGDTPNTLVVVHAYEPAPLVFEVRGLPRDRQAQQANWGGGMDELRGARVGCLIECVGGRVVVPDYSQAIVYDNDGQEVRRFAGAHDHAANFIAAVRSRRAADLSADIEEGHISSALCHAGNVSYRLGVAADAGEVASALQTVAADDAVGRMCEHLQRNAVDTGAHQIRLGALLHVNPVTERFVGNAAADALLTRPYRGAFRVPEQV